MAVRALVGDRGEPLEPCAQILAKVDVRTRMGAAAVAHRLGLADEDAAQRA